MTTATSPSASATLRTVAKPLLSVADLEVTYAPPRRRGSLGTGAALIGVDLTVHEGEILGIVGETGSGKTTLARATVGLVRPARGTIEFDGEDLGVLRGRALRTFRRTGQIQLAFQDPLRALDGDITVREVVSEPLAVTGELSRADLDSRAAEALSQVGLDVDSFGDRYPRQLSGGQRQRVSLARAIVTRPRLLFCDEPVSALDVSNRNLVLRLLEQLREELGLAVVIIAHDLSSLAGIADRVAVFYRGRLVEHGPITDVLERPGHPYTALLAASAPSVLAENRLLPSELRVVTEDVAERRPWLSPEACVFAPRCRFAHDACRIQPDARRLLGGTSAEVGRSRRLPAWRGAGEPRCRHPPPPPSPDPASPHPASPHPASPHPASPPPLGAATPTSPTTRPTTTPAEAVPTTRSRGDVRMSIEFIGIAATQEISETSGAPATAGRGDGVSAQSEAGSPVGPVVQPDYLKAIVEAHETSGFDRVLVAHSSASPDGFVVAAQILNCTTRLGVLLAHRPGFLAPTLTARAFATLDAFHPGRIAMHVITGGDDADQARDGDFSDKQTRYARTDDFLTVVRKEWESTEPFDHEGDFYRVKGGWSAVRPATPIPVYFGGASEDAIRVGGKHADVYAFWGEPLQGIVERIQQVRAAAAPYGRTTAFSVSLRPIVAATEGEAWAKAEEILERTKERVANRGRVFSINGESSRGSQRLLEYAAKGDVHDKRLWTAVAKATGAAGNSTALVGSYEQVAESLQEYVDLGVGTLLIRGFDPLEDAKDYGTLINLVRDGFQGRKTEGIPA